MEGGSHTTKQFSDTSWVSRIKCTIQLNSDSIYSIRPHMLRVQSYKTALPCPNTHVRCQLSPVLLTDWLGNRSEVLMTPSLGSINLLTELRKPIYSQDYWFIIKRI